MLFKRTLAVFTTTIMATSCSLESGKRTSPIGKFDSNVKGYIVEDMPEFTSKKMQQELSLSLIHI